MDRMYFGFGRPYNVYGEMDDDDDDENSERSDSEGVDLGSSRGSSMDVTRLVASMIRPRLLARSRASRQRSESNTRQQTSTTSDSNETQNEDDSQPIRRSRRLAAIREREMEENNEDGE